MLDKEKYVHLCFEAFFRVMNAFGENEKRARDYGTEEKLHPSEIHLIDAAGKNSGSSLAEIGRTMGVTRGAVQQLSVKLERLGYLERTNTPEDKKSLRLTLTEKGTRAQKSHEARHRRVFTVIQSQLKRLNTAELKKTTEIFNTLEGLLKGEEF